MSLRPEYFAAVYAPSPFSSFAESSAASALSKRVHSVAIARANRLEKLLAHAGTWNTSSLFASSHARWLM